MDNHTLYSEVATIAYLDVGFYLRIHGYIVLITGVATTLDVGLSMDKGSLMKLNKVNRQTSPYSALRDYIAQLHIIGRLMRMRISGVVLTASSARAVASFYIWVQLHLFSKLFPPLYPTPLRSTLLRLYKTWLELDQYLEASPPVIYPQASDNRFIVRHKLITGCMCFPISSCYCAVLASGWSSSPPKGEVWRTPPGVAEHLLYVVWGD